MKVITAVILLIVLAGCGLSYNLLVLSPAQKAEQDAKQAELELLEQRRLQEERAQQLIREKELAKMERALRAPPAAPVPPPPPVPSYPLAMERLAPGAGASRSSEPPGSGAAPAVQLPPRNSAPLFRQTTPAERLEKVSSKLSLASMAFAVTDKANIDDSVRAQLLISPNQTAMELEKQLIIRGHVIADNIKVSEVVKATLFAPDFTIKNITEEEQFVADDKPTEWQWSLKPNSTGVHQVDLVITAIVKMNGREKPHHLNTFQRTVYIEITKEQMIMSWIRANWEWLIGSLLVPLITFLFKEFLLDKIQKLFSKYKKKKSN